MKFRVETSRQWLLASACAIDSGKLQTSY